MRAIDERLRVLTSLNSNVDVTAAKKAAMAKRGLAGGARKAAKGKGRITTQVDNPEEAETLSPLQRGLAHHEAAGLHSRLAELNSNLGFHDDADKHLDQVDAHSNAASHLFNTFGGKKTFKANLALAVKSGGAKKQASLRRRT